MANRDGSCRVCGWNLAGGGRIQPGTLTVHLKTEPRCRQGYLDLEAAERGNPGLRRDLVTHTLHVIQQGGYLRWAVVGLMADGTLRKFGETHLRSEAQQLLARYTFFERRAAGGAGLLR